MISPVWSFCLRAVPFTIVGGGGGGEERKIFGRGEGPNSELIYPIRLDMISGRRGGMSNFVYYLPFLPPPPTHLNGTALTGTLDSLI